MGYWARLTNKRGTVLEADEKHDFGGSITVCGGSRSLQLDFTYNYGKLFRRVLGDDGIRTIFGMTGEDAAPLLESAARKLRGKPNVDHWKPTQGNTKLVLLQLAAMSRMRPDGVWQVH